ncbi:MAG: tetraacyldisaccharide 4'-kinase [Planctomycetia bacterium]|nr:tetraacyldisaccharide 4'-kinase [Planctomycetia bacterium]
MIRPFYTLGVWWRNRSFDRHPEKINHVSVPVLSVGNLTLGGTGKSPVVRFLALELQRLGFRVAVLSRGYRAEEQQENQNRPESRSVPEKNHFLTDATGKPLNDEGREMARALPTVRLYQNPDRTASAIRAITEDDVNALILDDGYQHRKLFRDGNILLIDAEEPFGLTGKLFPCGTLREPMRNLSRADVIILTHADRLNERERHSLRAELAERFPMKPNCVWVEAIHCPTVFISPTSERIPVETFSEKISETHSEPRFGAFCGIGKPTGFFRSLRQCGITLVTEKIYPDHHVFSSDEMEKLTVWTQKHQLSALLCTEKDAVKLPATLPDGTPIYALQIEMAFLAGEEDFRSWIQKTVKEKELFR